MPPAHESAVQAFPSSHASGVPAQTPAAQASPVEHGLRSSHVVPSGRAGLEQAPVAGLHVPGAWHPSDATHVVGVPATHAPLRH